MCRAIVFLCYTLTFAVVASGQRLIDVGNTDQKITSQIESKMPGWKHRRGEVMQGSSKVVSEIWSFPNKGVKVQIVRYETYQQAKEVLSNFLKFESEKEEIKGLGDEAYAWGIRRANVVFARGPFLVYVESGVDLTDDPTFRALGSKERFDRERSESKQLSIEFARHAVTAIDLP